MLTSPNKLDWTKLRLYGSSIVWTPEVYQEFDIQLASTTNPSIGRIEWHQLPFEPAQEDKFPQRGGIYILTYNYRCLASLPQEVVLYLGESGNLRTRMKQHLEEAKQSRQARTGLVRKAATYEERMRLLFASLDTPMVRFCTLDLPQDERRDLERGLIGLLDPPFNREHRPKPKGQPMVERFGALVPQPGRPAF